MITRSWIVAVQALVVGVLVVVVAVTLLKPEDSEDLAGVEAPGASSAPELPGPGGYQNRSNDGRRSGGGGQQQASGGAGGGSFGAPGTPPVSAAVVPPAAPSTGTVPGGTTGTVPGGTPGTDDGSPSDDQYSDTLSDLDARLR